MHYKKSCRANFFTFTPGRVKMDKQVKFKPEVSRAVFEKQRSTGHCIEHVPSASLVDEDEISSRLEFQEVHRVQKRKLHEHHVQRKKWRLLLFAITTTSNSASIKEISYL